MEEETEVLDWGNEDDEQQQLLAESYRHAHKGGVVGVDSRRAGDADDAEDAVSLGGDEDDMPDFYAYDSRSQQDPGSNIRPSTPKAVHSSRQQNSTQGRDVQREHSNSSQKPTSQSQASPQNSPAVRRSQSFGKMTHALPPKPVVSSVPFMHPSHPSIIEATAMSKSRHDRDKKSNGSIGKPVSSSDVGDPLPPDWESRHPSSGRGVYYYNHRTHESTWTRPVSSVKTSSMDGEKGRAGIADSDNGSVAKLSEQPTKSHPSRPEAAAQNSSSDLSYEDRHYRPSGAIQKDSGKREERSKSQIPASNQRSFTPPHSPVIYEREQSPVPRGRVQSRPTNSHRQPSPNLSTGDRSTRRDTARNAPRTRSPDRHWVPSREPLPSQSAPTRRSPSPLYDRRRAEGKPSTRASPAPEDSRTHKKDVIDTSSASRRRSPPSHEPPPVYELQTVPLIPSGTSAAPRQKSRFDRPSQSLQHPRLHAGIDDIYVPDDILLPKEDPGLDPTLMKTSIEKQARQRPTDDDNVASSVSIHDKALNRASELVSEQSTSVSASSTPPISAEQAEQSRSRKRQPLPPQSARFLEVSRQPKKELLPSSGIPQGPRDSGMIQQRPTNINTTVPSGPRVQPQPTAPERDDNYLTFARGARAPPSGPSAAPFGRSRGRPPTDVSFPHGDAPSLRDRDAMDVDVLPSSRVPISHDASFRANSGMYADREQHSSDTNPDSLPKGPRAMTSKTSAGTVHSHPLPLSASNSPTTSLSALRNAPSQDYRMRDRSPPPHIANKNGWDLQRSPVEQFPHATGPPPRNDPFWKADAMAGRPREEQGGGQRPQEKHQQSDAMNYQDRHETSTRQRRRPNLSHAPSSRPLPQLSGTNSVPIGNRKRPPHENLVPSANSPENRYRPLGGGNGEPMRNRHTEGHSPMKESYDRLPSTDMKAHVDSYRPLASRDPDTRQRRRSSTGPSEPLLEHGPSSIDTFQSSAALTRPRGDTYYGTAGPSHFGPPVLRKSSSPPVRRIWTSRERSPSPRPSYISEGQYRSATPPPPSRDPSPRWEASTYVPPDQSRPGNRFPDGDPVHNHYNDDPRPTNVNDSPRRRHEFVGTVRPESFETVGRRSLVGLEGRLSERYDDRYIEDHYRSDDYPRPVSVRSDREMYHDQPPSRQSHSRAPSTSFNGESRKWDRVEPDHERELTLSASPFNFHPDQAPLFYAVPSLPDQEAMYRTSKPVRIRRPGATHQEEPARPDSQRDIFVGIRSEERSREFDHQPAPSQFRRRPSDNNQRAPGSLLDRLSLDNGGPSGTGTPSLPLSERVQLPSKRDREEMMDDGSGLIEVHPEGDDDGGPESAVKRARRRNVRPKVRRGKRVSGPA